MHVYQTHILKEMTCEPTRLDFEQIVYHRTTYPSNQSFHSVRKMEAGAWGETLVSEYLEKYGKKDWIMIRNIWLNYSGPFEGDIVLLTHHAAYLIEVKNYQTDYSYDNGVSKWNDNSHSGNPINQTIRNKINLENIFRNVRVQGVLMLVGVDSHVEIHSELSEIEIVQRASLRHFIQKLVEIDDRYTGQPINPKKVLRQLEQYEIYPLQRPRALSDQDIHKLRKGVCCLNCKSYDVAIGRKEVTCLCGCVEQRELAILRTICDYGVLAFDRHLRIGKLLHFLGGQIGRKSLQNVLRKYFKEVKNGKYSYFVNLKLPYYKLYELLKIDSTVRLEMSHQDYENMRSKLRYYDSQWGRR